MKTSRQEDAAADALNRSIAFLDSCEAEKSVHADPYWPKWDAPWWHMTLLWEMGLADRIPRTASERMVRALQTHYLHFFPLTEKELPSDADPYRDIACHCALGTMYQVLSACGIEVDKEIPWIRPWFLKYQLPDGGLNCDEQAYSKPTPKSSIVSTLPPLEAVLLCRHRPYTPEEVRFLDSGAAYLIAHKLFRSTKGRVIREEWLRLCFPRFYEYDILRGLSFLAEWARARGKTLPPEAVSETIDILHKAFPDGEVRPQRLCFAGAKTLIRDSDGAWTKWRPAATTGLLLETSEVGAHSPHLTRIWRTTLSVLDGLGDSKRSSLS